MILSMPKCEQHTRQYRHTFIHAFLLMHSLAHALLRRSSTIIHQAHHRIWDTPVPCTFVWASRNGQGNPSAAATWHYIHYTFGVGLRYELECGVVNTDVTLHACTYTCSRTAGVGRLQRKAPSVVGTSPQAGQISIFLHFVITGHFSYVSLYLAAAEITSL